LGPTAWRKPSRKAKRSTVGVVEAYRELNISLDKFKAGLLYSTTRKVPTSDLRGVWANTWKSICGDVLDQAVQFMEEMGAGQRGDLLGPLTAVLDRVVEIAQLVQRFQLEPF
jgi:hypothetical protein